ncbi:DUF6150 family protein [Cesiribacter andamanensis]|uniref:7(1) septoil knot domain-containing protein n=1 Tax=Cesiribacter andamanensis AMV16 TaxID=1279009 RepID=M7NPK1_9BACT|nr:DUF6150 family protein [Cesiribacter andamanensis]EMR03645.1 hypothetical protein ADICEAN_01242 [Cesiribacter andamanensis AMV16]
MMHPLVILYVWLLGAVPAPEAAPLPAARDICQLKGSVYVTDNPQEAHFRVYIEEYESSAKLLVYSEENRLFADQPGLWHFTDKPAFANFKIYLAESRAFADFTIAYTDVASFAGCR